MIDRREYSPDKNGFNFVVLDGKTGKVIDRASFDLSPEAGLRRLSEDTINVGIRFNGERKTADLWITPVTPDILAGRELHVYMFTWDKDNPKKITRTTLSCGKYMTHRDGSNVPYYFARDFDVSGYDISSFGMMLFFVDDSDGAAVWKTKLMTDLGREDYKDPKIPSNITFREE